MHQDQLLAIRVYLLGDRFPDAVDVYSTATGTDRREAVEAVVRIHDGLRTERGYRFKVLWFRLSKSLAIGVPLALEWGVAASLWAWALDMSVLKTARWVFVASLLFGMLIAQVIKWRPHARAASSIYGGLAVVAAVAALVVKLVRWIL